MTGQEGVDAPAANADAATNGNQKVFTWLGGTPTCAQCGDRGHDSSSCSTPRCDVCCKYGHASGACDSVCATCGKVHKGPRCISCRQCGMWGHVRAVCHATQCAE
jgi:hypothetical protein